MFVPSNLWPLKYSLFGNHSMSVLTHAKKFWNCTHVNPCTMLMPMKFLVTFRNILYLVAIFSFICIQIYTYIQTHIMSISICINACVNKCTYISRHVCMYVCMYVCMHAYLYVQLTDIYIQVCIHTYINTYICIYNNAALFRYYSNSTVNNATYRLIKN